MALRLKSGLVVEPQHCQEEHSKGKGRRSDVAEPMFLYVQCGKKGMVFNDGDYRPYKDFEVNDKWFKKLLQSDKISPKSVIKASNPELTMN